MKRDSINVNEMMNDAAIAEIMRKESTLLDQAAADFARRKEMTSNKI